MTGLSASVELSAEAMERAEERLSEIRRLKRKYETDVPGLLATLAELNRERERLEGAREEENRLREQLRREEEECVRFASEVGKKRSYNFV